MPVLSTGRTLQTLICRTLMQHSCPPHAHAALCEACCATHHTLGHTSNSKEPSRQTAGSQWVTLQKDDQHTRNRHPAAQQPASCSRCNCTRYYRTAPSHSVACQNMPATLATPYSTPFLTVKDPLQLANPLICSSCSQHSILCKPSAWIAVLLFSLLSGASIPHCARHSHIATGTHSNILANWGWVPYM